jgi:hypothetical protein
MILKIKRERDYQDWWILDDIRKVSVSRQKFQYRKACFSDTDYDIFLLDNMTNDGDKMTDSSTPLSEKFAYKELICRTTKGDEFSIVFDTLAYLCNDEGKTIEKIVV